MANGPNQIGKGAIICIWSLPRSGRHESIRCCGPAVAKALEGMLAKARGAIAALIAPAIRFLPLFF
jgi:hypothetical protein